jgi:tRNA modification GTPase
MNTFTEDTIVALATPPGIGAISVIRLSGNKSLESVESVFIGKTKLSEAKSHTLHYGNIIDGASVVDDVLVSVFKSPNSYTGEDSIEISIHGSPLISKKIIELLLNRDVRLAEPGEFTKRAFLNNRIDLAQAEAVADVINSRTEASFKGARNQLDGILSKKIEQLRTSLINASSFIELGLDFTEEHIEFIEYAELQRQVEVIIDEIDKLLKTFSFGKVIRDGVNVAIVGQPNVGKSSIMNYILKESRAIVSKIPGTTRDIIREEVSIDGILFKLFDTAGIRSSEDEIEKEGISRSREAIKNADLVLFIYDVEQELDDNLLTEIYLMVNNEKIIKVLNKIDLSSPKGTRGKAGFLKNNVLSADVSISALTGEGMSGLINKLKELTFINSVYSEKTAIVSNLRHYKCLMKAKEYLINAKDSISNDLSGEFIAVDLRNAENSLGEIIGVVTTDDIINNIFTNFCIGK